jgi:hypothetical protein
MGNYFKANIRNNKMDTNTCTYCKKTFSYAHGLRRHYLICKQKDIQEVRKQNEELLLQYEQQIETLRQQYEQQIETLRQQYEQQIETLRQQYEQQIENQREQVQNQREKIEKLENQIFEIAKQPKQPTTIYNHNNSHNNQKTLNIIQQLADYDLDTLDIEQQLLESFTEEVFHGGPRKIIEMVSRLLFTHPETQKPKIICTDLARKNFKYRNPNTGEIEVDPGFQKTHDKVRVPLARANWNIYADKLKSSDRYRDKWNSNDSFIGDRSRFADKLLPSLGNVGLDDKHET